MRCRAVRRWRVMVLLHNPLILLGWLAAAPAAGTDHGKGDRAVTLRPGDTVEFALEGGGEKRMSVERSQPVVVVVRNKGIDSYARVPGKRGQTLAQVATWRGREGRYRFLLSGEPGAAAQARFSLESVEQHVSPGRIRITVQPLVHYDKDSDRVADAVRELAKGADLHLQYYTGDSDPRLRALDAFRRALDRLAGSTHQLLLADAHYELAAVYKSLDRAESARRHYKKSGQYYRAIGDEQGVAATESLLGLLAWRQGDTEAALDHMRAAMRGRQRTGQKLYLAQVYNNLGLVYRDRGEYRKALDYLARALEIYQGDADLAHYEPGSATGAMLGRLRTGGNLGTALNTLNNLALIHDSIGDVARAERYWRVYMELGKELVNPLKRAQAQRNLGALMHDLGRLDEALTLLHSALEQFERLDSTRWRLMTLNSLGTLYATLGRSHDARSHFQVVVGDSEDHPKRRVAALYGLAQLDLESGQLATAGQHLHRALRVYRRVDDPVGEALARSQLGEVLARQGKLPAALNTQLAAVAAFRERGAVRNLGRALARLGALHIRRGELAQARKVLTDTRVAQRNSEDALGEVKTLRLLAESYQDHAGTKALQFARQATGKALALRPGAVAPALRASFLATRRKAFELHLKLLMEQDQVEAGWALAERVRARSLRDLLRGRAANGDRDVVSSKARERSRLVERLGALTSKLERAKEGDRREALIQRVQNTRRRLDLLEGELEPVAAAPGSADSASGGGLTQFQAQLGEDSIALAYFLAAEQGYLWVVTAEHVAAYKVPGQADLEARIHSLQVDLRRPRSSPARIARRADALYRELLGPAEQALQAETLVVIPDGVLHSLPFGLLGTGESEAGGTQPLIAGHQIVSLPSAALLSKLREASGSPRRGIYVLADPAFGSMRAEAAEGAPSASVRAGPPQRQRSGGSAVITRLPGTRREARAIREYAEDQRFAAAMGKEATLASVRQGFSGDYSVVHLATHGVVNHRWPRLSRLLLAPTTASRVTEELRPHQISALPIRADLVVLSACESAAGQHLAGEGVLSLTRPFFVGGARSVVATLWKVSDHGTAAFMRRFYRHLLQEHLTPASALRAAQQSMRRHDQWSHPYFWAGFQLQGDWRVRDSDA